VCRCPAIDEFSSLSLNTTPPPAAAALPPAAAETIWFPIEGLVDLRPDSLRRADAEELARATRQGGLEEGDVALGDPLRGFAEGEEVDLASGTGLDVGASIGHEGAGQGPMALLDALRDLPNVDIRHWNRLRFG
jgi:hypothetical protein